MKEIDVTKENFDSEVLQAEGSVLVDFWAAWCGPCRGFAPTLSQFAQECGDQVKVCKVNVDDEKDLARRFRVMSIPTLLLFRNGEVARRRLGAQTLEQLHAMLKE